MNNNDKNIALCVDLDGTLIKSDTLLESITYAVRKHPLLLFLMPFWILKGKLYFKNRVLNYAKPNPAALPYNTDVIEYLKAEKSRGRQIVLATATVKEIADDVALHLGIFDMVIASDNKTNFRSSAKLAALVNEFGEKGFDYIGDSKADIKVWQGARNALLVNPKSSVRKKALQAGNVSKEFNNKKSLLKSFIKEIRVYQWVKNILIFLPLLLAHDIQSSRQLVEVFLAFISFSLVASSVYVLNDLLDIDSDRLHPRKKNRPIAAGNVSISCAAATIPSFLLMGFLMSAMLLPWEFTLSLVFYYILTTGYSFWLKKLYIIDIIILSGLYTLRLISGALAADVFISYWLLAFSMFIFLSLAMVKRYTELLVIKEQKRNETQGRGYIVEDLSVLSSAGTASGYLAVFVLALYLNSKEVITLYSRPELLWLVAVALLYWITRIWFMAHRGKMTDDPIVFTMKDKVSWLLGIIVLILAVGATL